jgi:O-antigen ligase
VPETTFKDAPRRAPHALLGEIVEHRLYARSAVAATLLLPLALLYTRAVGDILICVVALQFLLSRLVRLDWAWIREPWVILGGLFVIWQVICTAIAGTTHGLVEAVVTVRFFLFTAALEHWVLLYRRERQQLRRVITAIAAWIGIESWHQYLLGRNIFGIPRFGDGALTGPLTGPRAGPSYLVVFFPAVLPPTMWLLGQSRTLLRCFGILLLTAAVVTMLLIGQRMPSMLMLLGLALSGLFLRQFRWPVVGAMLAGMLLLAATPVISPPTYAKLVVHFYEQMRHFWESQYGLLFVRATAMVRAHPWLGLGFDGFKENCADPSYVGPLPWLGLRDDGDVLGCNLHPHNYWLQIATSAGLPGLLLFATLAITWLRTIGRGLLGAGNPLLVALFVTVSVIFWPIASTTSIFTVPNAGWVFLMIGWGLAEARDAADYATIVANPRHAERRDRGSSRIDAA